MDVFTKSKRSAVMSLIRSRGNRDTEVVLARLFRQHRITGWRRQLKIRISSLATRHTSLTFRPSLPARHQSPVTRHTSLTVRPDFVFTKERTAVFVDGCFWHACPIHGTKPKGNAAFWKKKLATNQKRDRLVNRALRAANWRVLRIWEHELARKRQARLVKRLRTIL